MEDHVRSNEAINLDQVPLVSGVAPRKFGNSIQQLIDSLVNISEFLNFVWDGPQIPRKLSVAMFASNWQVFPDGLSLRLSRRTKYAAVAFLWISWLAINVLITRKNIFATPCQIKDDAGVCSAYIPMISCGLTSNFWQGPFAECGLNAEKCIANTDIGQRQAFRCNADCISSGKTYQTWSVGDKELLRELVVIGGGGESKVYRGDSFICVAAIHAGIISRYTGGCGTLEWVGPHSEFVSAPSADNRFYSTQFDSEFPRNFKFVDTDTPQETGCRDLRIVHIFVNCLYIIVSAYTLISPSLFIGTLGVFGFGTVVMASQPPWLSGTPELNASFTSHAFARFLPFLLGLVYVYQFACRPQMTDMSASLSRALVYGGAFLVGVLENYTFVFIPVDRLIVSDLNAQPGAWMAIGIIAAVAIIIVSCQVYGFWISGRFRPYFTAYLIGIFVLILLAQWPNETLRLHHYIYSLALLPGTSLQTTLSLGLQGLFTGLYVSGVARWDFDSLLQTQIDLNRGNADTSIYDPKNLSVINNPPANLWVNWSATPSPTFNYYAVLINDVERAVIAADLNSTTQWFNLTEWITSVTYNTSCPLYVRIAVASSAETLDSKPMDRMKVGRFSKALVVGSDLMI